MAGHIKYPSKMGQKKINEGGDRGKILIKAGVKTGFYFKEKSECNACVRVLQMQPWR